MQPANLYTLRTYGTPLLVECRKCGHLGEVTVDQLLALADHEMATISRLVRTKVRCSLCRALSPYYLITASMADVVRLRGNLLPPERRIDAGEPTAKELGKFYK